MAVEPCGFRVAMSKIQFTREGSLVRSQYRPPAQTAPAGIPPEPLCRHIRGHCRCYSASRNSSSKTPSSRSVPLVMTGWSWCRQIVRAVEDFRCSARARWDARRPQVSCSGLFEAGPSAGDGPRPRSTRRAIVRHPRVRLRSGPGSQSAGGRASPLEAPAGPVGDHATSWTRNDRRPFHGRSMRRQRRSRARVMPVGPSHRSSGAPTRGAVDEGAAGLMDGARAGSRGRFCR